MAKYDVLPLIVGLNHRSAPVAVREQLAFSDSARDEALKRLVDGQTIEEGALVSTCNRVEVIACARDLDRATEHLKIFLAEARGIPRSVFESHLYAYSGRDAVSHVFRVAASLDSLVVGEPQILGQLKDAYAAAAALGTSGVVLHRCFHKAFSVAKRVRTETRIAAKAVSISSAAVDLACSIFDHLEDKTAMVIGAGEMGEQTVRQLQSRKIGTILVTNRTFQRAVELARQCNATVVPFEQLSRHLRFADVVIGSAAGTEHVVAQAAVEEALRERKWRPMFFIDLGVPRNFDPHLNALDNVFLYDIDDLEKVVEDNKDEREREAVKAEAIISAEVEGFWQWLTALEVTPTIMALREKAEAIRKQELEKLLVALPNLSPRERKAVEAFSAAVTNKLLHPPLTYLKTVSKNGNAQEGSDAAAVRRIFGLDAENEE